MSADEDVNGPLRGHASSPDGEHHGPGNGAPTNGAPANGAPAEPKSVATSEHPPHSPGSRAAFAAGAVASMNSVEWPEPDFSVLGVTAVKYAAAPMLNFDLHVVEPSGRQVYMIALTIQVMLEPARRSYDADTHERLKGLFGEPERWAVTTRSLVWTQVDVVIPAFTGSTTVSVPITCSYDLEVAASKYFYSLPDGQAPLAFHFNGTIYYRDYDDRMQMVLVPWTKSCDYRMPVATWKDMMADYYPNTAWVALNGATIDALQREQVNRGLATADACIMKLLEEGVVVPEMLEQLVDSLLFEGYALYPYTPGATKNATPTPFGIVYPPKYAETLTSTFDHLELRCVLDAPPDAALAAEIRFLAAAGDRHKAVEHRIDLSGKMVGALEEAPIELEKRISGDGEIELVVGVSLTTRPLRDRTFEVTVRVENRTECPEGLNRAGALTYSLLSTHPIARVSGGRFISPLERMSTSINTYPVLATANDEAIIGATIVLPDHPQIAPESRGGLFDSTEIEEALLLHVQVLTDDERADIEAQGDPTLMEMINRASAASSQDIMALHGRGDHPRS